MVELTDKGRPARNAMNGRFLKGHVPHNRGKSWEEWMDMRKARKIKRIAMRNLRPNMSIGGWNRRKVVLVTDDGKWVSFESATEAAQVMNLNRRNIAHCCEGKRKRCGGYRWFYFDDDRWTRLVNREQ